MAQPPKDHQARPQSEQKANEALERANRITLNQLTLRLERDPTLDLTDILVQQATSYPKLRKSLAEAALGQSLSEPTAALGHKPPSHTAGSNLKVSGKVQIAHPLHLKIAEFLAPPDLAVQDLARQKATQELGERTVVTLNKAIEKGKVLHSLGSTHVLHLGSSIVVKIGPSIDLSHIKTLQFVKSLDPRFPAPEVLGALKTTQRMYLFMSLAEGVCLEKVWTRLTAPQKSAIQSQLSTILRVLRQIPAPRPSVMLGSVSGRCRDARRGEERAASVPIKSEAEFNDFLFSVPGRTQSPWIRLVRSSMREDHRIVMTHGDLHPRNIMVTWDGCTATDARAEAPSAQTRLRITSILDWDLSGWYPEYWEFVKALNTIGQKGPMSDWAGYLPSGAIGTWISEYAIDTLISRWIG
jgi:Phosphotransferase enzyme family